MFVCSSDNEFEFYDNLELLLLEQYAYDWNYAKYRWNSVYISG